MTRRRHILAACVAVVVLGAGWWLVGDRLSPEEQRLVGTWRLVFPVVGSKSEGSVVVWQFKADRTIRFFGLNLFANEPGTVGEWRVSGDDLIVDTEPNPIRRMLRPVSQHIGLRVGPLSITKMQRITDEEFVIEAAAREVTWTRDRGD